MKKIILVHHYGGWGGAGIMLFNLIEGLTDEEFDITVIVPIGDIAKILNENFPKIKLIIVKKVHILSHYNGGNYMIIDPRFWRQLVNSLACNKEIIDLINSDIYDFVYLNSAVLIPILPFVKKHSKKSKSIVIIQETIASGAVGLRKLLIKKFLEKFADLVLFISEYDVKRLKYRSNHLIMRNWISKKFLSDTIFDVDSNENNKARIIFMGGMNKIKGIEIMLLAAVRLRRQGFSNEIIIMGDTRIFSRNIYYVSKIRGILNSISNITIRPNVANAVMELSKRDIVVFPITVPHQGRPILEAGYRSIPVVATRFECLSESVQENYNGMTFRNGDHKDFAEKIIRLLSNENIRVLMGQNNQKIYLDKFTERNILPFIKYMQEE